MFASRIDQENLLHDRAQAAATKSTFNTKTPGKSTLAPKTPFRVPLVDENVIKGGPAGGKSVKGDNVKTVGKKLLNAAYVTPAPGTKNRQALGVKTTNAKANRHLDASPQKTVAPKSGSPRVRRPKIKVLQAEAVPVEEEDDGNNDMEYMAPRGEPMPDSYDDPEFPLDRPFPQLKPENLTRGWAEVYMNADVNGIGMLERKEVALKAKQKATGDKLLRQVEADVFEEIDEAVRRDLGMLPLGSKTILSKSAAMALSKPKSSAIKRGKNNIVHQSLAQKQLQALADGKSSENVVIHPSATTRTPPGPVASRSTLGYARGRAVSARGAAPLPSRRPPVSNIFRDSAESKKPKMTRVDEANKLFDVEAGKAAPGFRPQHSPDHVNGPKEEDAGFFGVALDDEWDGFQLPLP
jgi:hypothetical protein